MIEFLNKQYPIILNTKKIIINNCVVGLFIFLFLSVFQPFGIAVWQIENKILKLSGYGFISCTVPLTYQLLKNNLFANSKIEDSWKVWKEIISNCIILVLIATCNLFYTVSISNFSLTISGFISSLIMVFAIAVFPVGWGTYKKYSQFLQLNQKQASEINTELHSSTQTDFQFKNRDKQQIDSSITKNDIEELVSEKNEHADTRVDQNTEISLTNNHNSIEVQTKNEKITNNKITIVADNEKDKIEINETDFFYLESQDNYTSVIYLKNNSIKRELIRSSLTRLQQQITNSKIKKCHRSYIVNLKKVDSIEGNAAGYKLKIVGLEEKIPVSRSYSKEIIEELKSKH